MDIKYWVEPETYLASTNLEGLGKWGAKLNLKS